MADHGLDGGASFELALDLRRDAPLRAVLYPSDSGRLADYLKV
jgi:hypothetical protein